MYIKLERFAVRVAYTALLYSQQWLGFQAQLVSGDGELAGFVLGPSLLWRTIINVLQQGPLVVSSAIMVP